ncbi:MAG TPA: BON domain-containing protein [Thermoanaerobaculia bacterium]|nr:BON domain-containing protein [Thermoanaerobaculia bacterium]HUM29747.1 BON domain-containing protein [Thermoanaerobaculia bacterium]HXK67047.1 BON domain-containing protein [Thermoanaerobaculia bacterium]
MKMTKSIFIIFPFILSLAFSGCAGKDESLKKPSTELKDANKFHNVIEDIDRERVILKAKLALLETLHGKGLHVHVDLEGTTAHLTGTVTDRASIELAETITQSIEEIHKVQNDLSVEEPEAQAKVTKATREIENEVSDAMIVSRIKIALIKETDTNAFSVNVGSAEGTVTLEGTVDSQATKETMLKTAESVTGVQRVIDLIDVSSP